MSIKQTGGVFGRNPTFNDVTIEGQLTFDGDIDINSDLKVDGDLDVTGKGTFADLNVTDAGNTYVRVKSTTSAFTGVDFGQSWGGSGAIIVRDNHPLLIHTNGVETWRFDTAGNLKVKNSGNGIDFSATAGTGTSELFDDYEEGVWTPTGAGAGAVGVYTKMGDTVFAYCEVTANSVSTNTISGLPFTAGAGNSAIGGYFGRARFAGIFDANGNEVRIRILGTDIKFMTNGGLAGDASATITTGGGGIVQLAISVIYKV